MYTNLIFSLYANEKFATLVLIQILLNIYRYTVVTKIENI